DRTSGPTVLCCDDQFAVHGTASAVPASFGRTPASSVSVILRPSASCCFDRGDVDLFHFHHRLKRALRGRTIRIGRRFQQYAWGDLPGQAPFVLAPSACALGAAIAD